MATTPATSNEEQETFLSAFHHRRDSSHAKSRTLSTASSKSAFTLPRTLTKDSESPFESEASTPTLTDRDAERQPLLQLSDEPIKKLTDPGGPLSLSTYQRNIILLAIWGGFFAAALDMTLMTTLLPLVSSSFQSAHQSAWLGTSYLLSTLTFTPLYGRLLDILGRRNSHSLAIGVFGVGTLLCGLAPSMNTLIIARFIAGMGGGGMTTTASVISSDLFTIRERGVAGMFGTLFWAVGAGAGGPLGGFLADYVGWRFAFLIQMPFLIFFWIVGNITINYKLPNTGKKQTTRQVFARIDWLGTLTLFIGFLGLLVGLSAKNNQELPFSDSRVYVPFTIAAIFAALFIISEAFFVGEPIFPLPALRNKTRLFAGCMQFFTAISNFMVIYHFPLWFLVVEGVSSSEAGLHILPQSVGTTLGSAFAGWYIYKTGKYYWIAVFSGLLPILSVYFVFTLEADSSDLKRWLSIFPSGFGYSSMMSATFIGLLASIPHSQIPVITGSNFIFRGLGQTLGVGLGGALLQSTLARELSARITGPGSAELIERLRHDTTYIKELSPELREAAVASYRIALKIVFACSLLMSICDWLCCLNIGEHSLEQDDIPKETPDATQEAEEV